MKSNQKLVLIIALGLTVAPLTHGMEEEEPEEYSEDSSSESSEEPSSECSCGGACASSSSEDESEPAEFSVQDLIDEKGKPLKVKDGALHLGNKGLTSLIGLETVAHPELVTELNIYNNKITEIPDHIFDRFINLEKLNLGKNNIVRLQPHLLELLTNLRELNLKENQLTTLAPHTLDAQRNLRILRLKGNRIFALPDHIFDACVDLERLDLTGNPLIQIQPNLFEKLVNLEDLDLAEAGLVEIPPRAFDAQHKLKNLSLYDNNLESLPHGALNRLGALKRLYLQNNKLIALDPNLLENQENLKWLDLSNNQLRQLPDITHLTKLKNLFIGGNKNNSKLSDPLIAFILGQKIAFDMPEALGKVPSYSAGQLFADLGDNWIQELLEEDEELNGFTLHLENRGLTDLSGLPENLKTWNINLIDAKNNFLKEIPLLELADKFPGLWWLDLGSNLIEKLPMRLQEALPGLMLIDLSNNKIETIPIGVFNNAGALRNLDLSNNRITTIDDGAFEGLSLNELNLKHNKLQIVPKKVFSNIHFLAELKLEQNRLGSKEEYVFLPDTRVKFYPQKTPMLKIMAAKRVAEGLEGKNLVETVETLQRIPVDILDQVIKASSKNVALKIHKALKMIEELNRIEEKRAKVIEALEASMVQVVEEGKEEPMQKESLLQEEDSQ